MELANLANLNKEIADAERRVYAALDRLNDLRQLKTEERKVVAQRIAEIMARHGA